MSNKTYQSKPSWNLASQNKNKSNQNLQNSLPIQAKSDNDLDSQIDHSEYKGLPSNAIMDNIQRSFNSGNYLFPPAPIQAKLTIGSPGDQYEQEADQVAEQVVQKMNAPATPNDDQSNSIQRKFNISSLQRVQDPQAQLQRKFNFQAPQVQADFETNLSSAKNGGSPLEKAFRAKIEPQIGADFGGGNNITIQRYMGVLSEKAFKYNTTSKFNVFGMGRSHLSAIDKVLEDYDNLFQPTDFYKVIPTHEDGEPAGDSESSVKDISEELRLRKKELKILNQLEMTCKVPESEFKKYDDDDQSAIVAVADLVKSSINICVKLIDKLDNMLNILNPEREKMKEQKRKESSPEYQREMKEKAKQTTKEKEDKFLNDIRENRAKTEANEQANMEKKKANEQEKQQTQQKQYEEAVAQAPNNIKIAKKNLMSVEQFKKTLMSPPHNLSESHFKDHEFMKRIVELLTQFHATSAEDVDTIIIICRKLLWNLDKYIKFIQERAEASSNMRVKEEIDKRENFINEAIYFVVETVIP